MSGVKLAVFGGIAVIAIAGSVVGGIIASVISEGDIHKEHMVTSPPPPSPPARRMMTEHEELYGKAGNSHFDLTHDERKVFHKLAAAAPIFKR